MMDIITYFFIGLAVGFMLETINRFAGEPNKINMVERLLVILLWPIMLTLFIYHFIKSML
jgi:hypothetical protein|tara:strand:+ start:1037 stop:1216 length:180 start_codon:yes stop_codon:yes gene_type:complete